MYNINLEIYLKKILEDKTKPVPILASTNNPPAVSTPIAATHQRVAYCGIRFVKY